jgi:hypothetical protein
VGRKPYSTERVWLVSAEGGAPRPLTPALRPHGQFEGYLNAWTLGRRLYLQAVQASGAVSIVRQYPRGGRRTVPVPGRDGVSDGIITADRGRLLLQSDVGLGGPSALFWFNPVTGARQVVFRAPAGAVGVVSVLPFGYWNGLSVSELG